MKLIRFAEVLFGETQKLKRRHTSLLGTKCAGLKATEDWVLEK